MRNILFIGDSITDSCVYTSLVDSYINFIGKNKDFNFYNIGLCSENTSGLSEVGHPFPRPNIHDRIDKIINYYCHNNVDTAIILYGVNDGIYRPFDEERFSAYKNGITLLIEKLNNANINVMLCTPTYFDNKSCLSKMTTLEEENQNNAPYGAIYGGYDDVMAIYAQWVNQCKLLNVAKIINIHNAMKCFIENRHNLKTKYTSGDGIHPNFEVATVMASTILNEGLDLPNDSAYLNSNKKFLKLYKLIFKRDSMLHSYDKEYIGHCLPWKSNFLPKEKLQKQVAKLNNKIDKLLIK